VLRDELKLVGTKFGCGIAQCGACTVHLDGQPVRSCQIPVSAVSGMKVTTVEGLAEGEQLSALQQACYGRIKKAIKAAAQAGKGKA
jgi:isoquinoline 1-oxidoreductase alpha subunit